MLQIDNKWPFLHRRKRVYNRRMPDGYLTVREAAQRLGVDESRIKALIKVGKLKAERFGKRMWVIKEDDFAEFEATRNTKPGRPRRN